MKYSFKNEIGMISPLKSLLFVKLKKNNSIILLKFVVTQLL